MLIGSVYEPDFPEISDVVFRKNLEKIFYETQEDLDSLSQLLMKLNVKISRPTVRNINFVRENINSRTYPYPPICPRDFLFLYKDQLIVCRGGDKNRQFEELLFSNVLQELIEKKITIQYMPSYKIEETYRHYKELEGKIFFHAACILKCENTLIHSTPYIEQHGRGTYAGLEWLKKHLPPETNWITGPFEGHADGKIALIRHGLALTWSHNFIPKEMLDWDFILVPPTKVPEAIKSLKQERFYKEFVNNWLNHWIGSIDETVFDLNLISVNENLVITNGYDPFVFSELKKRNVEAIPFYFRHKYFWDSGLHCISLDLERTSSQKGFFA